MSGMTIELAAATIASLGLEPGETIVVNITDPNLRLTKKIAQELISQVKEASGAERVLLMPYGMEITKIELAAV